MTGGEAESPQGRAPRELLGRPASPGKAAGPAVVLRGPGSASSHGGYSVPAGEVEGEVEQFDHALAGAFAELESILETATGEAADILQTQLLMMRDPVLVDRVREVVRAGNRTAEDALALVVDEIATAFRAIESEELQSRVADVRDVQARVARHLAGSRDTVVAHSGTVVVARDVLPSEVLSLSRAGIVGLALEEGAVAAHAMIMARSLGLPAVVGVSGLIASVTDGETVLVDGDTGRVSLSPDQLPEWDSSRRRAVYSRPAGEGPALTADGRRIHLYANIGRPEELADALAFGAEGVGLLRTEFLFLERSPDEEEQYAVYADLAARLGGRPLVVRTLDAGGDKPLPHLNLPAEQNPLLGVRGIRFTLAHPKLLRVQLRALLRASVKGNVRLMYPMVSDVAELDEAARLLDQARSDLASRRVEFAEPAAIGTMVEVPAAAICADALAGRTGFFSIGTNDLAQYCLAADRGNAGVAGLYDQTHPAVLRLIERVVQAASAAGIPVTVCGEAAADLQALPLLVGLGVVELSMAPAAIPRVREALSSIRYEDAVARASARVG